MGLFIVGLLVLPVTLVAAHVLSPASSLRLRIPGLVLLGLSLVLIESQLPPTPGRLVLGLAMVVAWGGTGLALMMGKAWGRLPGLVLSVAGVAVASWVGWRVDQWANARGPSGDRILVDILFLADGPSYSWIEVGLATLAFAFLSALAGAFLLLPHRAPVH